MSRTTLKAIPVLLVLCAVAQSLLAAQAVTKISEPGPGPEKASLETVLAGMEKCYANTGFCADFKQTATLKGMGITDNASGTVCFKYPDKVRWKYKAPEEQAVVSDGKTLWLYRPLDNQVIVGAARDYFGCGEGASFLSDVKLLKKYFIISWAPEKLAEFAPGEKKHVLKLAPKAPRPEFTALYLVIEKDSFHISQSISYNDYGDATRIRFEAPRFDTSLPDSDFVFKTPKGVEVLRMGDQQAPKKPAKGSKG